MSDNFLNIINKLRVPKVILRFIMMNFLDLNTIKNMLLTVKEMNILDNCSKDLLVKADKGFIWNCRQGHLTVAKWLYSVGGGEVNVNVDKKYAFIWSCHYGHLTVAKWLYSLGGIDVRADDESAFLWSFIKGHLTVTLWLYSLGQINIHADSKSPFKYTRQRISNWLNEL